MESYGMKYFELASRKTISHLHFCIFNSPNQDVFSELPDLFMGFHCQIRILYEVFPMSYLMEQAGGQAFTGKQRVCLSFSFHLIVYYCKHSSSNAMLTSNSKKLKNLEGSRCIFSS